VDRGRYTRGTKGSRKSTKVLCLFVFFIMPFVVSSPAQDLGLRMIVVKTEGQARDLRARIQNGESFEDLARKYSTDTSASAGGYLGTFVLSDLRKDFQDSLSRLHPADVTPILPLNGDYVLLQLLNEGEARWLEQMATGRRAFQQRQYGEAEHLFQAAIEQAERFGPKDARLGASLNALGVVYFDEKNYAAAEPLFKRALSIREESLGPEHPDVGATLNNLAEIYWSQKNYAAAGLLFTRALEIAEKTLGAEHPNVGDGLNNLAALYRDQGNYVAAEPLYKRSLAIAEKAFGPEHPNVGAALVNLAGLYHDERNYVAAEPSYKRALAIYEKALGPEHPSVRERIIDLAELYQDQGNSAAAEPLYRRALEILEKNEGVNSPNVAGSLVDLAVL